MRGGGRGAAGLGAIVTGGSGAAIPHVRHPEPRASWPHVPPEEIGARTLRRCDGGIGAAAPDPD